MNRINSLALLLCLASAVTFAQNRVSFAGVKNAADFAYGLNSAPSLTVGIGNTATGSQTITVQTGTLALGDGTVITPLSTTAPILIGEGANIETVTPSAVVCTTPNILNTCSFTATFTNTHVVGEPISSGTFGLEEAINAANGAGGGLVAVDARWTRMGGVTATITGNKSFTNVTVLDYRGTTGALSYASASNGAALVATAYHLY